ncbi:MAG: ubiquinone biosynthesis regulatory protein kinase UbiB [Halieaceae bacterium]|jgi:ubiquinone biosynthesis protein|nr:ubiquinone biosynthesis regulatory protein kinase UbiB [Halieaceae bacterium]
MSRTARALKIAWVFSRYRLDTFIDPQRLPAAGRWLWALGPWRLTGVPRQPRGERLRLALEALGPVFIKFGQMLSTRRDLLPDDIADELARLQDQVPPFSPDAFRRIVEQSLGADTDTLFASFDAQPLASASVAQVHTATLHSGEEVVVKVIRPGIEPVIRQDLRLLHLLARMLRRLSADGRRLRPVEVVNDYEITILDELDLQREAANASQLRRNWEGSPLCYVPEVHWDYTRRDVYTMERIHGVPVTDLVTLRAAGTDLKLLAERGVEIFFTQVFRDSFFHADMHPGNIFVDITNPADPRYIAVDCAIIGSLSYSDQYYLARNLLAIFRRDYRECAELHVECGWVPPGTRVQDFEAAMRAVCEPVFEKPLAEISFGQLLIYLFQTARRFNMEVQPSLVLLQKTLLNIEGLGRQLYPQLDLWTTAMPYLERWLQQRYSPQAIMERMKRQAPGWLEQLPKLPEAVFESLQHTRELDRQASAQRQRLDALQQQIQRDDSRRRRGVIALLMFGGAAATAMPEGFQQLAQWPLLSWALVALGLLLLWPRARP